MLPITELRGTIPYFILNSNTHWFTVFFLAVSSNITIGLLIRYLIAPIFFYLKTFNFFSYLINPILKRTESKLYKIEQYKLYGLILFIGIPLPITGVWTGALASYILSMSKYKSFIGIIFGSLLSGIIVTAISLLSLEIATSLIPNYLK